MHPIKIQLENQHKHKYISFFNMLEEIHNSYEFEVYTRQLGDKMKSDMYQALSKNFPLITTTDGINFQMTEHKSVQLYITKQLMAELEEKYPEALI